MTTGIQVALTWMAIGVGFCGAVSARPRPDESETPNFGDAEGWSIADSKSAEIEGWNVWDCDGSAYGRFQLCKYDEQGLYDDDANVWDLVWTHAEERSALHIKALQFICRNNPKEFDRISARNALPNALV